MPGEWPRRLFHSLGGAAIAISGLLLPRAVFLPVLSMAVGGFVLLDIIRFKNSRLNTWFISNFRPFLRTGETTRITGASYMGIGAILAFFCFEAQVAALSLLFLAAGDPVSGVVRVNWGTLTLKNKSLASSSACFAVCVTIGMVFSFLSGLPVAVVILAALAATVIEATPLPVNDNITIPFVSGGVMMISGLFIQA